MKEIKVYRILKIDKTIFYYNNVTASVDHMV